MFRTFISTFAVLLYVFVHAAVFGSIETVLDELFHCLLPRWGLTSSLRSPAPILLMIAGSGPHRQTLPEMLAHPLHYRRLRRMKRIQEYWQTSNQRCASGSPP
jgi:hypothetical protein